MLHCFLGGEILVVWSGAFFLYFVLHRLSIIELVAVRLWHLIHHIPSSNIHYTARPKYFRGG